MEDSQKAKEESRDHMTFCVKAIIKDGTNLTVMYIYSSNSS